MGTMTEKQLKTLGEKFIELSSVFMQFIEQNGLDETKVEMGEAGDERSEETPLCKTPLCHGGWLAVMFEQENIMQYIGTDNFWFFEKGSAQAAEFLGFASEIELEDWADDNPEIWGNAFGVDMFSDSSAFGVAVYLDDLTLTDIAKHYAEVGKRCITESKKRTNKRECQ